MLRWLLVLPFLATPAIAQDWEPPMVSIAMSTSGRWLEGARVTSPGSTLTLEGGDLSLGGAIDVTGQFHFLRYGAQLGVEAMLDPGSVRVTHSGPLTTQLVSQSSLDSLVFFDVAPFVGLVTGDTLTGFLDVLVSTQLVFARFDETRHLLVQPVPMLRLGCAVDAGVGFELSVLMAYFGAPRVSVLLGLRF